MFSAARAASEFLLDQLFHYSLLGVYFFWDALRKRPGSLTSALSATTSIPCCLLMWAVPSRSRPHVEPQLGTAFLLDGLLCARMNRRNLNTITIPIASRHLCFQILPDSISLPEPQPAYRKSSVATNRRLHLEQTQISSGALADQKDTARWMFQLGGGVCKYLANLLCAWRSIPFFDESKWYSHLANGTGIHSLFFSLASWAHGHTVTHSINAKASFGRFWRCA